MDELAATVPTARLSMMGQTYVAMVGALAVVAFVSESHAWYVALVVVALPLSLLALWVGFYALLAVGFLNGSDPTSLSWPLALVWTSVWMMTAWLNARIGEKVARNGWVAGLGRR